MTEITLRQPEYSTNSIKVVVQTSKMTYHEIYSGPISAQPDELFDNLQDLCSELDQNGTTITRILNIHDQRNVHHATRGNIAVYISEILWSHKENEMYNAIDYAIPEKDLHLPFSHALQS